MQDTKHFLTIQQYAKELGLEVKTLIDFLFEFGWLDSNVEQDPIWVTILAVEKGYLLGSDKGILVTKAGIKKIEASFDNA